MSKSGLWSVVGMVLGGIVGGFCTYKAEQAAVQEVKDDIYADCKPAIDKIKSAAERVDKSVPKEEPVETTE